MYLCSCNRVVARAKKYTACFFRKHPCEVHYLCRGCCFLCMSIRVNLVGQKFGKLTVLGEDVERNKGRVYWICKCDCGNIARVTTANLRSGSVKSCGCLVKETAKKVNSKHNMRGTRLYSIWVDMRRRCRNKNYHAYKNYGGRGIFVCKEWDEDFMPFYNWSINNGYADNLSIDRINNNDGYYPENCRWVTALEQGNNTRICRYITIDNITKSLADWCRVYNTNAAMVRERIKRGWDEETAIKTPQILFFKRRN